MQEVDFIAREFFGPGPPNHFRWVGLAKHFEGPTQAWLESIALAWSWVLYIFVYLASKASGRLERRQGKRNLRVRLSFGLPGQSFQNASSWI